MNATAPGLHQHTTIVGIGNVLMGDDGVGIHVINRLEQSAVVQYASLRDLGTSAVDLLQDLMTERRVIVVDAIEGGHRPGTVYRFTPEMLPGSTNPWSSSHASRLGDVLATAKSLGGDADVLILGVEPERIAPTTELSPQALVAVEQIVGLVIDEVLSSRTNETKGECL